MYRRRLRPEAGAAGGRSKVGREQVELEGAPLGEDERALGGVLQLADVARPIIALKQAGVEFQ